MVIVGSIQYGMPSESFGTDNDDISFIHIYRPMKSNSGMKLMLNNKESCMRMNTT